MNRVIERRTRLWTRIGMGLFGAAGVVFGAGALIDSSNVFLSADLQRSTYWTGLTLTALGAFLLFRGIVGR